MTVIESSDFASNIYEYIPFRKLNIVSFFITSFEFELTNQLLEPPGIKYDSSFANIFPILMCISLMILFTIFIYLLRLFLSKFRESGRCSCFVKTIHWVTDKLYKAMVLSYFIRNALEMSQFVLITSVYEVYKNNTMNSSRIISFAFAILMIVIYLLMVGLVMYLAFSSYKPNASDHNKLEEFFRGLKIHKKYKLYVVVLLLRRITFITLLITCVVISSRVLIIILALIQVVYFVFLTCTRPCNEVKGNLIEILNEIYFSFLLIVLSFINSENDWNNVKTNIYLWVLVSNTLLVFIIVSTFSLVLLFKWLCRKCQICKEDREVNNIENLERENLSIGNVNRVLPKQTQPVNRINYQRNMISNGNASENNLYPASSYPVEESKSNANLNISMVPPFKRYYWRNDLA